MVWRDPLRADRLRRPRGGLPGKQLPPARPLTPRCAGRDNCTLFLLQVAVAVLRKMDLGQGEAPAEAAQAFARALHDAWGVGDPACQNGVLFLLAVDDRQVFISTGAGAQKALSDARVASTIRDIRPQLRDSDYDAAVKRAVVDVGLGLAGGRPKGEARAAGGWVWCTAMLLTGRV